MSIQIYNRWQQLEHSDLQAPSTRILKAKKGDWWFTGIAIHPLYIWSAYSSSIARPRFVARASLIELNAPGGKLGSVKCGCNLADDNSWSLFNRRLVSETFRRGHSCQLSSFNCSQQKQPNRKIMSDIHNWLY